MKTIVVPSSEEVNTTSSAEHNPILKTSPSIDEPLESIVALARFESYLADHLRCSGFAPRFCHQVCDGLGSAISNLPDNPNDGYTNYFLQIDSEKGVPKIALIHRKKLPEFIAANSGAVANLIFIDLFQLAYRFSQLTREQIARIK